MSKKSLVLGATAILCGALSLNAEVAATQSAQIDLKFNAANFTQESVIVGGKKDKISRLQKHNLRRKTRKRALSEHEYLHPAAVF